MELLERFQWSPGYEDGHWIISFMRKGEEKKTNRGSYQCIQITQGWMARGWGQTLFSGAEQQDKSQ